MKRYLFILLLSITATSIQAREGIRERLSFATTLGTGVSLDTPSPTPVTWQALVYYRLGGRWWAGVGSGLSVYEKTLIPLFGTIRFRIGRERRFTPYAEWAIGAAFAPSGRANGGFFMNPSLGVCYALHSRAKLQLAVGYEQQELERLKRQADGYFEKEFAESLRHNTLSVRIGVRF